MAKITITFPDGEKKQFNKGITPAEIAELLGRRLAKEALAARVDDEFVDLNYKIMKDCRLALITFETKEGKEIFRHGTAHLLAHAVSILYPEAKNTIGPAVEEGFYYDFDNLKLTPDDLPRIEAKMRELVQKKLPFERIELTKAEAKKLFRDNPYKLELIDEFKGKITAYKDGDFVDLCRGPHVPNTSFLKAIKLTKIAGAYWRGDARNKQLTRIYGISFPNEQDLNDYLKRLEEAEKRDHRRIGSQLELFSIHEEGPGFIFWHPKGTFIWNALIDFWRKKHAEHGYQEIRTPIILNKKLWLQSGHWEHYKENMYFTKIDDADFAIKPMNCPGGILVYKSRMRSYKELPLRMCELGLVHRHELSGVLSGLFRVRAFTQDDAHLYVTEDTLKQELKGVIRLVDEIYRTFGFSYDVVLSTKPEKAMGSADLWEKAETALAEVLEELKLNYRIDAGAGAFYGPKIDFMIKDAIGRTWQCGTLQLDFQMPERFGLEYMGDDGTTNHRPIMLHRTVYGSLERFIGVLIEHYAGKFPLWLSPVQARVLSVSERFNDYAKEVVKTLRREGIRAELDDASETLQKKVRNAQLAQINYILVVGEREQKNRTVAVRTRDNIVHGEQKIDDFIKRIKRETEELK